MRILIIEDENKIAELIENRLKKENYMIDISNDGDDGYYKATSSIYDLIILDVMLPYKNGFEILKDLREENIESKILMLTAKDSLESKLEGFNKGADDYLTKPFHLEELVARVNNLLKKHNKSSNTNIIEFGDLELDLKRKVLIHKETKEEIEVLCKEFLLLECLMKNNKSVLSKEYLYDYVWGMDNDSYSNNLEAYLSFIRKKLKELNSKVNIKASRGLGYKMEVLDEKSK